jgi:DNA-binding MarR family transcriptional regulator
VRLATLHPPPTGAVARKRPRAPGTGAAGQRVGVPLPVRSDFESRVIDDHHQALKLWLRLLSCTTRIEDAIRNRLRSEFGTTLPRFDLLAQLERHPAGLTMSELSQRLMVTGGNVTGITDQLEREGLVLRAPHASDRRAYAVRLTPAGRRQFRRMAATHEEWIVQMFSAWSESDKKRVQDLLATLKEHLAAHAMPPTTRRKPKETAA